MQCSFLGIVLCHCWLETNWKIKWPQMDTFTNCRLELKLEPICCNRNKYFEIQEFKPNDSDNLLDLKPVVCVLMKYSDG